MHVASRFLGVVLFVFAAGVSAHEADPFTAVVDGLQSLRGLTFGPGGRLYVAQAGSGTNDGKVTEIRYPWLPHPPVRDLVAGLVSQGDEGEFVGVAGLSSIGNGNIYAILDLSNAATGFPSRLGHLIKVSQGGQIRDVPNVGDDTYLYRARAGSGAVCRHVGVGRQPSVRPVGDCFSS